MALDLSPFFERYENIIRQVDAVFAQVQEQYPEQVRCGRGCSDCCYALFDLSLVEALYLNHHFNERFTGMERSEVLDRADEADREIHRLKRRAYRASQDGRSTADILVEMGKARVRCPLLGKDDLCVLYENRPLTCRLYGVPLNINGEPHSCGRSGFEPGKAYPTVHVEKLQDSLMNLSHDLALAIKSRYSELGAMLVPPSMALLTDYDESYLGVPSAGEAEKQPAQEQTAETPIPSMDKVSDACNGCDKDESACATCKDKSFSVVLGGSDDEE
ncbi:Putative zinc-or iron-chelating domain-containing protein [Paucidesulfovibrio gracilis DSM 16080]|uniref:Putative zinc-or iron-chelating domain-containing protein n=1 Tax=Paucidesulfovibrio gracilis DSM 16080 TaxID=1121449 RepID=A0A1T4W1B2_9BACT|nr:YkgJ family cysteine cluster protein [Paucidesulfovibrio gracilis]SKA71046.1 Putative zinc-or iron-chelating domain-containing protein [Paucidesulfovibrio gracilis DSM 16080]